MAFGTRFDVIVYGATGYTGRLVCEYLSERSKQVPGFRWAIAGRSAEKLEQLRLKAKLGDIPIVVADASAPETLVDMAESTRVVLTTVGPYTLYGSPLVKACAGTGTDYCDLTGEPNWMRQMIDSHEASAKKNGARILFCCGFDSVPSELGVWYLQQLSVEKFGRTMPRVRGRVLEFKGGPSGGSAAVGAMVFERSQKDSAYQALMQDPFALTPGFRGPDQPSGLEPAFEEDVGQLQPFMLGPTDAKNVRRSNFLMGNPYGADFVYDEMLVSDQPPQPPAPGSMPKPGEGPSREQLEQGSFAMKFIGTDPDGNLISAYVKGSKDPGYLMTSRMITETALCLLEDTSVPGGMWNPGAAFQGKLLERLTQNAFMTFEPGED